MNGKELDDPDLPFFLSANGDSTTVSRPTFQHFSEAVGLPSASANTLRKSATTKIRRDASLKTNEPVIMDHTAGVADKFYDQSRTAVQVKPIEKFTGE